VKSCAQLRKIDIYRCEQHQRLAFASSVTPMTGIVRSSFPAKFNRSTIFCSIASCGPFPRQPASCTRICLPILIVLSAIDPFW
jgi:hypothetical protein